MRLDRRIVELGLAPSRARAQALVRLGVVRVDGAPARKAAQEVGEGDAVTLDRREREWVSRAALKLLHALDAFGLDVAGDALDLGASTGGFTEVLLERGARRVFAVDVGYGQLHPRLAADPRVISLERRNARDLGAADLPPVDWITADLSFIGLAKALPPALALAREGATAVLLVKPQFEVGPERVGKGGIVRERAAQEQAVEGVAAFLAATRWRVIGRAESPILGGDGNREFLLAARK